jgi:hypothetical protein
MTSRSQAGGRCVGETLVPQRPRLDRLRALPTLYRSLPEKTEAVIARVPTNLPTVTEIRRRGLSNHSGLQGDSPLQTVSHQHLASCSCQELNAECAPPYSGFTSNELRMVGTSIRLTPEFSRNLKPWIAHRAQPSMQSTLFLATICQEGRERGTTLREAGVYGEVLRVGAE